MALLAYASFAIRALMTGMAVSRRELFMRDNECEDPVPALKIQLADLIVQRIAGWAQVDAANLLRTTQPRISDLRNGRLERFSLEQLVRLVRRVEGFVELHVDCGPRYACFFEPINAKNGDS